MAVLLNVVGADFDVEEFLSRHPDFRPANVWRRGEVGYRERVTKVSGFNVRLREQCLPEDAPEIKSRLERLAPALAVARTMGAALSLDVGLIVSPPRPMLTACFPPDLIGELARQSVTLSVSGYAGSGD